MKQPKSSLFIQGLELSVFLGWPDKERAEKQIVKLDITLTFPNPPSACQTDQLDDTICYATLIQQIHEFVNDKPFHLIENLVKAIYQFIKSLVPIDTRIKMTLTKHPAITGLTGGVSFTLMDD